MENTAKALIMAGGLLISILVISFMMMVLRKGGQVSSEYDNQIADQELAKFNSQFEIYVKSDNTFFDVITVANLAWDVNKKNGYDEQNGVTIKIMDGSAVIYSILPKKIKKNHFFENDGREEKTIYIYNSENDQPSIVDKYTERKEDNSDYFYRFDCTGENSIQYNDTTGKVTEMLFKIVKN